jgi:hypothetical protein
MECAFDCGLNYVKNKVKSKDGSRECQYSTCNFSCDGLDMDKVINGVEDKQLDYSTYQLYYSNPRANEIRSKIEQTLRKDINVNLDSMKTILQETFSEEEINNALYLLEEESENEVLEY